jgi:hypothetical protein
MAVRWWSGLGVVLQSGRSWIWFPKVSLDFPLQLYFRPHYVSGFELAFNKIENQEYFQEVKLAGM